MKKYLMIMFILILALTSCNIDGTNRLERPNTQEKNSPNIDSDEGGAGGTDIAADDDIEPNINYIDINEDEELTNSYLANTERKKDISFQENSKSINKANPERFANNMNLASSAQMFVTQMPEDINVDIQYHNYDIPFNYLLITADDANIYSTPSIDANIMGKATQYSKIRLEGAANLNNTSNAQEWYLISWLEDEEIVYGYITSDKGEPRTFRFDRMIEEIESLENMLNQYDYGYISNYKNRNGSPPVKDGKALDEFGIQAYQSAPAYYAIGNENEFRYFPDGMLVFVLDEANDYFLVRNLAYEGDYWIPKQYISFDDNLDRLNKTVVVDKANQNEALFENRNDRWTMISYTLATTGVPDNNKYETPTGSFKVLQKRDRFYYLNYRTGEIGGYAPYGTRFSAGAYIHGVPVNYVKENGENVDPGMKEYLLTIGTTPRSAKCVRNYTSHAKFVYDWADLNDTAVIVFD